MMDIFKLDEDEIIDNLSKGNIARVKLILGFCQDPEYILLDEPFTGIDLFKREEFIGVIAQYMEENQAIIITTHEIVEIESLVDEVVILDEGQIITSFNAEELREREGKSILDKMRRYIRMNKLLYLINVDLRRSNKFYIAYISFSLITLSLNLFEINKFKNSKFIMNLAIEDFGGIFYGLGILSNLGFIQSILFFGILGLLYTIFLCGKESSFQIIKVFIHL